MNKMRGFVVYSALIAIMALIGIVGWVLNVIKLVGMIDGAITGMMILRMIGLFIPPLGAILGLFF